VAAAAVFSEAASKVVGLLGASLDAFAKLKTFTGVPQLAIGLFAEAVIRIVASIRYLSTLFTAESVQAAIAFANGVQQIVAVITSAMQAFSTLGQTNNNGAVIVSTFGTHLQNLIAAMQAQALPAATGLGIQLMIGIANGIIARFPATLATARASTAAILQALQPIGAFGLGGAVLAGGHVTVVAQPSVNITIGANAFNITVPAGTTPAGAQQFAQQIAYQVLLIIQQRTGMRLVG
jgi:hypothetical protein